MPSPFPGMDPFLEHPAIFPDLHDSMITYVREALQARLPDPYYAEIGNRLWVEVSQRPIRPDVNVLRPEKEQAAGEWTGESAVLTATRSEPLVIRVPHDERRETFVEIYARLEGERLVASIEILSLANKAPGEHGRDLYLRKQQEVLNSPAHLIEIDLLRGGEHTTAVPHDRLASEAGPFDYHVCVHRYDNLEDFFVYPVRLEDRLPEIAVPLLPGDPSVPLDLQAVFDRCYDTGPYRRRVRYEAANLDPPLSLERAAWALSRASRP